jgi:hypothetical protein
VQDFRTGGQMVIPGKTDGGVDAGK